MKIFLLILSLLLPLLVQAQWEKQVGINTIPLLARTLEINSEFKKHQPYAFNFSLGYTFRTGHTGLIDSKVYDGIKDRETSGAFAKAGMKLYPLSFSEKKHRNNFYIGAFLVFSQYEQTALKRQMLNGYEYSDTYLPVSASGVALFPATSLGFVHQIGQHIILDWGVQKSFVIREDNYLGRRGRNYQPGAGSHQSDPFIGYLQGIISIRYRFGSSLK